MTKIGLIQMHAEPLEVQANLSKANNYISQTAQDGAEKEIQNESSDTSWQSASKRKYRDTR